MYRAAAIILSVIILTINTGCKKEKPRPLIDMDTIKTDGSHDDRYIFRKEIEKEEYRDKKYQKKDF